MPTDVYVRIFPLLQPIFTDVSPNDSPSYQPFNSFQIRTEVYLFDFFEKIRAERSYRPPSLK